LEKLAAEARDPQRAQTLRARVAELEHVAPTPAGNSGT
jgi:hypothetical protein